MKHFISTAKKINPIIKAKIENANIYIQGDLDFNGVLNVFTLPDNLKIQGSLSLRGSQIFKLPTGLEISDALHGVPSHINDIPADLKAHTLNFSNSDIKVLPDNMFVEGSLLLRGCNIRKLPQNLRVNDNLDLDYTLIQSVPATLQVGNILTLNHSQIKSIPKDICATHLFLRETRVKNLPKGFKIKGTLDLSGSDIETLPDDMVIGGELLLNYCKKLKSIPKGLVVGGISAYSSSIKELPDDIVIKGIPDELNFRKQIHLPFENEALDRINDITDALYKERNSDNSECLYNLYIENYPQNERAYEGLMFIYLREKKHQKLLNIYKRGLRNGVNSSIMMFYVGLYYYIIKDFYTAYYFATNAGNNGSTLFKELKAILELNCLFHFITNNTKPQYYTSEKLIDWMWIVCELLYLNVENYAYIGHYSNIIDKMKENIIIHKELLSEDYEILDVMELLEKHLK